MMSTQRGRERTSLSSIRARIRSRTVDEGPIPGWPQQMHNQSGHQPRVDPNRIWPADERANMELRSRRTAILADADGHTARHKRHARQRPASQKPNGVLPADSTTISFASVEDLRAAGMAMLDKSPRLAHAHW